MFEHILVPLDGSSLAECVLSHVIALATTHDADVTLFRVLEKQPDRDRAAFVSPLDAHLDNVIAQAYLDELAQHLSRAGVLVETAIASGSAAVQIVAYAQQNEIDLIVMSSHGKSGLSSWNMSSVAQKVAARAHRSVMIVHAYVPPSEEVDILTYRRLLVPLDGSQRAEYVLPIAVSLARAHDARLVLAHVVHKPEMPRQLWTNDEEQALLDQFMACRQRRAASYLEEVRKRLPVEAESELQESADVAGALQALAEEEAFDLILLSAHGYSGSPRRTYGSVAANLIGYCSTPLLIVQDLSGEQLVPSQAELVTREHQGH
ncbi:MAG: universal stress protein [Anaerolineae bacterium]|jgi:nucleotide-binding universal stress UspA family protein